jgi:glycosyltransferase involved in cell wall biosynthesis
MKILYVSDCFTKLSVFDSQVHTLCNRHMEKNEVTLLTLCGFDEIKLNGKSNATYALVKALRLPKSFIPLLNKIDSLLFNKKKIFMDADIIHCRGHVGTAFAINVLRKYHLKKPIIADIRGEIVEEKKKQQGFLAGFFSRQALKLEKLVFNKSSFFFFVSQNMLEYYFGKYSFHKEKSAVFPTIVDEKRFYRSLEWRKEIRERLNLIDKFVFVYLGGTDYWQNINLIISRFAEISKKNKDLFLLLIVKNSDYVKKLVQESSLEANKVMILTLPYEEVGKYLNAADAGIIIRDDNIINYVASPTKINEYLACGLKIIDKLQDIDSEKQNEISEKYNFIPLNQILLEQQNIYSNLAKEFKC